MWFSSYRADTICDRQTGRRTDGQTDGWSDRRTPGKNNMSPDPEGGDIKMVENELVLISLLLMSGKCLLSL